MDTGKKAEKLCFGVSIAEEISASYIVFLAQGWLGPRQIVNSNVGTSECEC